LGVFTNNTVVGYYSIAEKIVVAIGGLFGPANQTIYPYLAKKYKDNFFIFIKFIKKITLIFLFISFSFVLISEYFKYEIISLITGHYSEEVNSVLSIFIIRILTFPFGSFFSNLLIIMNEKEKFLKVMNYTVLLDLIIVPPSIYFYHVIGLVTSYVVILILHTFLLLYYLTKVIKFRGKKYDYKI
jgi:PST family polysaccharide transporter